MELLHFFVFHNLMLVQILDKSSIYHCLSVIQQIHLSLSKDREWLATLSVGGYTPTEYRLFLAKDHHFLNFQLTSYIRSITKPMSQKECCKIAISSRSTGTGSREKPVITDSPISF